MEAPLIEVPDGTVTTPEGFLAGAADARVRDDYAQGRLDLALLHSERPCAAAATYTQNSFLGPPLRVTRAHLANGRAQAVIANSGIANCLTGEPGVADAEEMARLAAAKLGLDPADIAVASTGVTGWRLPMDRIRAGIDRIITTADGGDHFAHAIMTTDTVAKQTAARFQHDGVTYSVGGCAKGSGMIAPNMATMLSFLTTDAAVDQSFLQSVLSDVVEVSYNMMTIDGDTSPEDLVLLLANGAAANGAGVIDAQHPAAHVFRAAVEHVAVTLARKLARDGEGASKLIEVRVDNAATVEDARRVAKAVASSALVKTAVYGNDPNWGRVLVAAGNSGARIEEPRVSLAIQDTDVYRNGEPLPYEAAAVSALLAQAEVRVRIDLALGDATATAWGCDLTPEYVRINSEYTT
ncbi:MAG: bifunctional glutamate N-acetyltransferase/amino-acid acetyltransferase ArgJ [Dehalococcoidia bacterium]